MDLGCRRPTCPCGSCWATTCPTPGSCIRTARVGSPPRFGGPPVFANTHGPTDSRGVKITSNADPPEAGTGLPGSVLGNSPAPNQNLGPNHGLSAFAGFEAAPPQSRGAGTRWVPPHRHWKIRTGGPYRTRRHYRWRQWSSRPRQPGNVAGTMSSHEENPLGLLIAQVYRLLLIHSTEAPRPFGLTVPQEKCLNILDERPAVSKVEMAAELDVTPQAVSTVQWSLEDAGLVERCRNSTDGRVLVTSLTDKGRQLFKTTTRQCASPTTSSSRCYPPLTEGESSSSWVLSSRANPVRPTGTPPNRAPLWRHHRWLRSSWGIPRE